jgi:peptidoglycan-N-acetylglucosamine deacetylase
MYLTTSTRLLRWFMPRNLIWEIPEKERILYLTFDDGPVTGITDETLAELDRFNAKATFFCVGDNVKRYPDTYRKIIDAGHSTGNHTFYHLNGWKTPTKEYIRDVHQCAGLVDSTLFRPPYGRITRKQTKILSNDYKIIMWSVLSGDFDPSVSADQCFRNIVKSARPGSVILMHDNQRASKAMLQTLPHVLEYYLERGYKFKTITFD